MSGTFYRTYCITGVRVHIGNTSYQKSQQGFNTVDWARLRVLSLAVKAMAS